MIFQDHIFVLIAVVGMLAMMTGQRYRVNSFGHTELRYGWIPVLAIMLPLIYWAGTRGTLGLTWGDTSAYQSMFLSFPSSVDGLLEAVMESEKDKGFVVFSVILKLFIGDNVTLFFLIIAAISLGCVVGTYKKFSCSFFITMFLFVASGDYLQWNYNGIRQFLAVSVIFACTGLILKKKYLAVIVIILIVSTIHASALIMIPIIYVAQGKPWNKKTILLLLGLLMAISFVDQFTDLVTLFMENSQYSSEVTQFEESEGTNMLRVAVYSIPALLSLVFKRRIEYADNKMISFCTNMSIACMATYALSAFTSGLFMGRLGIYFALYNYILLPWEIENIFEKKSARLLYFIMIGAYLAFYYYQVVITWHL